MVGENGYRLESRLFGEQGMFGALDESLDFADGYFLGKAVGTFLKHRHPNVYACIASDAHPLSVPLESEVVRGLLECGVRVLSFSVSPTPLVRFAATELQAQVAFSVTRGSLPETHSGVKVFLEGTALDEERALLLRNIAANGNWRKDSGGRLARSEGVDAYTMRLFAETAWRQENGVGGGEDNLRHRRMLPRVLFAQSAYGGSTEVLEMIVEKLSAHAEQLLVLEDAAALRQALREEREQVGFLFNSDGTALQAFIGGRGELRAEEIFGLLLQERDGVARKRVVLTDGFVGRQAVREWETCRQPRGGQPRGVRVVRCSEFGAGMLTCLSSKQGTSRQETSVQRISEQGASERGNFSPSSCATFSCDGHMTLCDSYYPFEDAFYVAMRFLSGLARGSFRLDALRALPSREVSGLLRILVAKTKAEGEGRFLYNKDALLMQLRAWVKAESSGSESSGSESSGSESSGSESSGSESGGSESSGSESGGSESSGSESGGSESSGSESGGSGGEVANETEEVERNLSYGRWIVRAARFEEGLLARYEWEGEEGKERVKEDLRRALASCGIESVLSEFVLS